MKYTIEVTQDDIKNGYKKSCTDCPIALACRRAFQGGSRLLSSFIIGRCYIHTDKGLIHLPYEATIFITDFDSGSVVHPFTFEVTIP